MKRGHKNSHNDLSPEFIRKTFDYDLKSGELRWKQRLSKRIHIGDVAGVIDDQGRRKIGIRNKEYFAHRIAWVWMAGEWPPYEVDHRDHVKSNNAWINLRLATSAQNKHYQGKNRNNKSGYKGVCWDNNKSKWLATINKTVNGKKHHHHLGWYDDPQDAHAAYVEAAIKLHGPMWARW